MGEPLLFVDTLGRAEHHKTMRAKCGSMRNAPHDLVEVTGEKRIFPEFFQKRFEQERQRIN